MDSRFHLPLKPLIAVFLLLSAWRGLLLKAQIGTFMPVGTATGASADVTGDLRIGVGDLLHILIFDTPELEQRARVENDGTVQLQLIGAMRVEGLTPAQASKLVRDRLIAGNFMRDPQVSVQMQKYEAENVMVVGQARLHVTVIGQARVPGVYSLPTPSPVLEVLALAGGLGDAGDRHILIERYGTGEKVAFYDSNDSEVVAAQSVMVYPGDIVIVPKLKLVYALGDVAKPGGYMMQNNESGQTVLQLVAQAGGTAHTAVPSHTRLIRRTAQGYDELPLSLSDMQKGKKPDIAMQEGDIIYVPFSYMRNLLVQASGILASATSAVIYAGH